MNRILAAFVMVFLLAANAFAGSPSKTLYKFKGGNDGAHPYAGFILDAGGNLYGTTRQGGGPCSYGHHQCGTVVKVSPNADGTWTESVLYRFTGGDDGARPFSTLTFDAAGNLYGTAGEGGSSHKGTVFKLTPNQDGTWTESTLYTFGGTDGGYPRAGLTFDGEGNLYGTTLSTVFKLTSNLDGSWTESVVYTIDGSDGYYLYGGVIFDGAGDLYGTTWGGGSPVCSWHCGVVFELTPNLDGSWTESVLHRFTGGKDGSHSYASLTFDAAGNLYGATSGSGNRNVGTVFQLTPNPDGTWTENVLHRFPGQGLPVQYGPHAAVTFDAAGNLYGTTLWAGPPGSRGEVFKLTPRSGGQWAYSVLHAFTGKPAANPNGGLVFDQAGKAYGTTLNCVVSTCQGVVFEVSP
jgi:uncharacterized repeat protein (TIGR03803 family)